MYILSLSLTIWDTTRDSVNIVNKGYTFWRVVDLFYNATNLVREYDWWADIANKGLDDVGDPNSPFPHSPQSSLIFSCGSSLD